jgi:hypothetical protein
MATYISVKDERMEMAPKVPPFFSASELERFVEGQPAFLHLHDGSMLVYNDVFYEIGVERNEVATQLAHNIIPDGTWIAGSVLYLTASDFTERHLEMLAEEVRKLPEGTFQLYMLRFEIRDELRKYLYDNLFVIYVRNEIELHMRIAAIAMSKAQGQKFLGAEKRAHGLTVMHELLPAIIRVPDDGKKG